MQQPTGHVNVFVSVTEAVLQDATLFLVIRLDWNLTIISLGESFIHRSGKLWKRSAWTCMDAPGTFSIILNLLLQNSCSFLDGVYLQLGAQTVFELKSKRNVLHFGLFCSFFSASAECMGRVLNHLSSPGSVPGFSTTAKGFRGEQQVRWSGGLPCEFFRCLTGIYFLGLDSQNLILFCMCGIFVNIYILSNENRKLVLLAFVNVETPLFMW